MTYRSIRSLVFAIALGLTSSGVMLGTGSASAAHPAGILLFTAATNRDVAAGEVQKIWVHSMALAGVTLKVDYGDGQVRVVQGHTDDMGVELFQWTIDYVGTAVKLARFWVYVTRGALSTDARGDFVIFPAPPLRLGVQVLTPSLRDGGTLRVRVLSRPGAALDVAVKPQGGHALATQRGQVGRGGEWIASVPISTTIKQARRFQVVVNGASYGRTATVVRSFTLSPRMVPWLLPAPETAVPAAAPASLAAARREALSAAADTFSVAQTNARTAVASISTDLQILQQWTSATPAHFAPYYWSMLDKASTYQALIDTTAQALADDGPVQAAMRESMPHKAVMVSLGEQVLRAYEDGRLVMFTYITTGRPQLPTVTGHFFIYEKVTPFQFHSPWPPGSPFYYPPTWIKYWMPFYSGYGLHDAWWRAHYGPGTDVNGDGPGSSEPAGTHGCVNIPFANTVWLWNWAPVGTPVVVYGGPSVTPGAAGI